MTILRSLKRINHTFTFAVHIGHISHIEVAQVGFAQHFQVVWVVKETAHIAVEQYFQLFRMILFAELIGKRRRLVQNISEGICLINGLGCTYIIESDNLVVEDGIKIDELHRNIIITLHIACKITLEKLTINERRKDFRIVASITHTIQSQEIGSNRKHKPEAVGRMLVSGETTDI